MFRSPKLHFKWRKHIYLDLFSVNTSVRYNLHHLLTVISSVVVHGLKIILVRKLLYNCTVVTVCRPGGSSYITYRSVGYSSSHQYVRIFSGLCPYSYIIITWDTFTEYALGSSVLFTVDLHLRST